MTVATDPRQEILRERLRALGFDDVRFASLPEPAPAGTSRREPGGWVDAGFHADMQWMERTIDKRRDPRLVLPGARSLVMLGVSYWPGAATSQPRESRWARYAQYEDYHDTMKPGLVAAGKAIEELYGVASEDYRYYVDTGPVIDRAWAARAGIGFVGKNAMLISREHGNWLFLGAILARVEWRPDPPLRMQASKGAEPPGRPVADGLSPAAEPGPGTSMVPPVGLLCGKCTRCLDACPTAAFAEPGVVDARRCISYQTIENKGIIPRELRTGIGNRIYGCDVCLEVCPWNRFAQRGRQWLLAARGDIAELPLAEILALTPERFAEVFRRTPIKRLKLAGLLRNACIVAGNSGDRSLLSAVVHLAAQHPLPMVRAHAVWAARQLGGADPLVSLRERETDPMVLAEYG